MKQEERQFRPMGHPIKSFGRRRYDRLNITAAFLLILILFSWRDLYSFDGRRNGFIMGLGLGAGYTQKFRQLQDYAYETDGTRETEFDFLTDFRIGYAPSDKLLVYYMNRVAWRRFNPLKGIIRVDSLTGVAVSYFLESQAPSAYVMGGIGLDIRALDSENSSGLGLTAGLGFEITKALMIEAGMSWSPHTEKDYWQDIMGAEHEYQIRWNIWSFRLTLNILGY